MPVKIRIVSDWVVPPFHLEEEDEDGFGLMDTETFQEIFDLPDHVMDALLRWDAIYQANLNWDIPSARWPSREAELHFLDEGRAAVRLLRRHVPDDVSIEYLGSYNTCEYF